MAAVPSVARAAIAPKAQGPIDRYLEAAAGRTALDTDKAIRQPRLSPRVMLGVERRIGRSNATRACRTRAGNGTRGEIAGTSVGLAVGIAAGAGVRPSRGPPCRGRASFRTMRAS